MNQQNKSKMSAGMVLWTRLEQLRKSLESTFEAFDELYQHVSYLKKESSRKQVSDEPPSQGI